MSEQVNQTEKRNDLSIAEISAANLAYLGDCVYELYVREMLVRGGSRHPSVDALKYVTARTQSAFAERILPMLTEDEESAYKRGRNIGHSNTPKSSTTLEYRRATGLEVLFGWLYLTGRHDRVNELIAAAIVDSEADEKSNNTPSGEKI